MEETHEEIRERIWKPVIDKIIEMEDNKIQKIFDDIEATFGYNWMKEENDKFRELKTKHLGRGD